MSEDIDLLRKEAPNNSCAEKAILGLIIVNNEEFSKVEDILMDGCFYQPAHKQIFNAIKTLLARDSSATVITLASYFDDLIKPDPESLSYPEYIAGALQISPEYIAILAANADIFINIVDLSKLLYELHLRRELIQAAMSSMQNAYRNDLSIDPITEVDDLEKKLFNIRKLGYSTTDAELADEFLSKAI